jgi:hypothetical protein
LRGSQTGKFLAVDRFATAPVSFREVPALKHEAGDNAMERGSLVPETVLFRRELPEILSRLWNHVVKQPKLDAAGRLVIYVDIKLSIKENVRGIVDRRTK